MFYAELALYNAPLTGAEHLFCILASGAKPHIPTKPLSKGIFSTKFGDLPKTSVHNQPLPTRFVNCLVAYFVVDPPKKVMKKNERYLANQW